MGKFPFFFTVLALDFHAAFTLISRHVFRDELDLAVPVDQRERDVRLGQKFSVTADFVSMHDLGAGHFFDVDTHLNDVVIVCRLDVVAV